MAKISITGKILNVDLTSGTISVERVADPFLRKYFGGSALGMYYLLHHTPTGADPLGAENTLVFTVSPLTGTPISGQSRMTVCAKSPLTGTAGDTNCGGDFPTRLRSAGYNAVVIRGCSPRPVYLWLYNGSAELRSAGHLWGQMTGEVQAAIRTELGDESIAVAQCGPAGVKLVRFANIISDSNRANGRNGLGAVMGSKNLKAVAAAGTEEPFIADRESLQELDRWGRENFETSGTYGFGLFGTSGIVGLQNELGGLPTRNWSSGTFEGWSSIDGRTMARTMLKSRDGCFACTIRCKRVVEVKDGSYPVDPLYGGPEYQTVSALGSACGVSDLAAIAHANQLCNMHGMDTISCGGTIAWAMDCFEHGILTAEDTGGVELRFGDADAMVQMISLIARRQGFGNLLAEGSARAAEMLQRGSQALVVAVKNQEYPAHMPQVKRSLALIYAVNPFGADHQSHERETVVFEVKEKAAQPGLEAPQPGNALDEEKVRQAYTTQLLYGFLESADLCEFVYGANWQLYSPEQMVAVVRAVTGWQVDMEELLLIGERRLNMMRAFNAREGMGREADTLPAKIQKALAGGESEGAFITQEDLEKAKDLYYTMAGWEVATGNPTREKLESLGLGWVGEKKDQ